jgi:uncharacterized protein with HEPN domain
MLLAARELGKYTRGVSFEEFDRNRLLQHAVTRLIEIVERQLETSRLNSRQLIPKSPGRELWGCGIG